MATNTYYAVMSGTTMIGIAVTNGPQASFAAAQGWLGPITPSPTLGIGSTTPDGGVTWTTSTQYVTPATVTNAAAISVAMQADLTTIENWITANSPGGATLNAAQTLAVAKMLSGLARYLLGLTTTTGGAT
jgi:hypothetical protein